MTAPLSRRALMLTGAAAALTLGARPSLAANWRPIKTIEMVMIGG